MATSLAPVIAIDDEKCKNCHACIAICPVKYCNDGSGETVKLNHETCIGCGACLTACRHEARLPLDDTARFLADVRQGRFVAVVAPAIAVAFPDRYLNLNGWLASIGVDAVFDVSFGAELTVKTYLDHIERRKPATTIAQPCPAIVTYIETYAPELLPYLSPADSPMGHTIKLIQNYYPQYARHRIAVISPCVAKKREFEATGAGDYNVTFSALAAHFEAQRIRLESFPARDYDNPPAERAVLFSTPGGLLRTAMRWVPNIDEATRKIEGQHVVYKYLEGLRRAIDRGVAPALVDCLNCDLGCNGGTGTNARHAHPDEIESLVTRRSREMRERHRKAADGEEAAGKAILETIEKYWRPGLYERRYENRAGAARLRKPSPAELKELYTRLAKQGDDDILDCAACGYGSCEAMAVAIHNELNRPENCQHFRELQIRSMQLRDGDIARLSSNSQQLDDASAQLAALARRMEEAAEETASRAETVSAATHEVSSSIRNVAEGMTDLDRRIADVAASARSATDVVVRASTASAAANETVRRLGESGEEIGKTVRLIRSIAFQTNCLALNAAIEAARAGDAGRGFSVVAGAVKDLAKRTSDATEEITTRIGAIQADTEATVVALGQISEVISQIEKLQHDITKTMEQQAQASTSVTSSVSEVTSGTSEIATSIEQVAGQAQLTQADAADAFKATETLAAMAQELRQLIARFGA